MAGLTIFVLAGLVGCALAAPAPAPHYKPKPHPGGCTPYTIQAFFYCIEMYECYEWSYYDTNICMAYDINCPANCIPTCWYDDFERMCLQAKCDYIDYCNKRYPMNYGPNLWDMPIDQLTFDYLIMGGSPGSLTIMTYLIEMGYTVAIVDSGLLAPPQCRSPYYAPSLLGSPYMNRCKAYIPGCNTPKHFYTPKIFGGMQMIESNQWMHGGQSFYKQMAQCSSYFDYNNVMSRFSSFEYYEKTTTESVTSVSSGPFGMSYYTYTKETTVSTSISNWYSELGYNGFSPFDDCYNPGLYCMPTIGSNGMYSLYIDEIFSKCGSFDNIFMFLGVEILRLIYDCGIITGCEVMTPYGPKIISCRYDVFFGSSPIDMFKILNKSGIGNPLCLNRFGIQPQVELPALGTGFKCMPSYVNPFICLPKFSLVPAEINDYSAMSFMYSSQSYMTSFDSLCNYRAFMNVGGSSYSNSMYQFYAFNCLMTNRLEYILNYQFQLTYEQIEYVRSCLVNYDILFITSTLTDCASTGYLDFGDTMEEIIIQTEMYSNENDILCMLESIMYLQKIFETSSFMGSGAEIRYLSSMGPSSISDFFNTNSIRSSLSQYTYPSFQPSGGAIMGNSISNSCVNDKFNFYNCANLFCLNSGISPYSVPCNNLAFNTLMGNFAYDIVQERINNNFYETMRSADFYNNMINSNMSGLNSRSLNTMGIDTMGINGINSPGMNGYNNMGGINSVGNEIQEEIQEEIVENSMYNGGMGVGSYGSGMSSSFSESEMEAYSSTMGGSSLGHGSLQGSSSYMSKEMEASSTMIGGGGAMVSEYEMEMESSSMQQSSFGGGSYYSQKEMEVEIESSSGSTVIC